MDTQLTKLTADTIRILSAEAIQKAKSGHPGMPMGCADFAVTLWSKYLRFNPKQPKWFGRDRFILSAGHGSMLQYSLLHLFGYNLPMEEIQNFRQWDSRTPGHPEYNHTDGVDITTGPLGSGFASAVGMAISQNYLYEKSELNKTKLAKPKIYVIAGDGCMMEGTTAEAASLAGHLKLDNIICFYDDNEITIEGSTNLAFSEDVKMRFEAYGWRVIKVANANDVEQCDKALAEAVNSDGKPTLIIGRTTIGFGAPKKAGSASSHGEPLGEEELAETKKALGFNDAPFSISNDVYKFTHNLANEKAADAAQWDTIYQEFIANNPAQAEYLSAMQDKAIPANILDELLAVVQKNKKMATRASSGLILQKVAELVPSLMGGAADLAPSTKTAINCEDSYTAENHGGRNVHFGVRELGMAMAGNGMALSEYCIPYVSTFFVFSDYMKPAMRLAAIQNLHQIYLFTHDSFYVGEDGPTHEPIEQIAMLRSLPNMTLIRPADGNEVAHAWAVALKMNSPVAMLLTRQDLEPLPTELLENIDLERGAYVLSNDEDFEAIIMATGSEVRDSLKAANALRAQGKKLRVVSFPSWEIFEKQSTEYKESVLPKTCKKRISVEAASTFGWSKYTGDEGINIGIDHFGASAPFSVLQKKFGFTADQITAKVADYLK
ncbi:transketolase [Lentisphaerota bacterium WC36G]|nr:transketolase [Lentisphaerae bacterium WC36]